MTAPWRSPEPLASDALAQLRRRAIFECCKWDPQVEDTATVAGFPIILEADAWQEISTLAESLAGETLAAEAELVRRVDLHAQLGVPRSARRALARGSGQPPTARARLIRFDFHHTRDGWRISEANTDVPGGLNEASGLARLMTPHYPGASSSGDVAGAYAQALIRGHQGARVALVHATGYVDDRQVMEYLARRLAEHGAVATLASPSHLRWHDGRASVEADWGREPVDVIARFFPAEWLPNLSSGCGWVNLFGGAETPVSNPAVALLTQSKRFPLVWDSLSTPLPTWRAMLPETRDPRDASWRSSEAWVIKPALGRVGEDIGIPGVSGAREWAALAREVTRHPAQWAAQRRFEPTVMRIGETLLHPCIGVYTVGCRAVGAYGRLATRALIDYRAQDVAVLVADRIHALTSRASHDSREDRARNRSPEQAAP